MILQAQVRLTTKIPKIRLTSLFVCFFFCLFVSFFLSF